MIRGVSPKHNTSLYQSTQHVANRKEIHQGLFGFLGSLGGSLEEMR
jgi:hypothetical protein